MGIFLCWYTPGKLHRPCMMKQLILPLGIHFIHSEKGNPDVQVKITLYLHKLFSFVGCLVWSFPSILFIAGLYTWSV